MKTKKILIIRFSAIGDVVLSTVIPQAIKHLHPECEIHYLTREISAFVLENCPYIDRIWIYRENVLETINILKKEKFDVIISLNYTLKNYAFTYLSFPRKAVFKSNKGISWVENYFNTAKKVFPDIVMPKSLHLINSDISLEQTISDKLKQYPKPHIFINPGFHAWNPRQGRVWNIDNWKKLTEDILTTYGGTVFVNGSGSERDYHLQLESEKVIILSGFMSIKESAAALSMADLVISGDSGPIHIASAYGVNTLALLGSTSPDKIKPYGENGYYIEPTIKCKYCWKRKCKMISSAEEYTPCMESITPDIVMEKIATCKLLNVKRESANI